MKYLIKYLPNQMPFLSGMLISYLGTLPLGYINIIALQILIEKNIFSLIQFCLGVVLVEFLILCFIKKFTYWIIEKQNLLFAINIVILLFFGLISFYFLKNYIFEKSFTISKHNISQQPFLLGIFANSFNIMQWPYWSGVFFYLHQTEKLKTIYDKISIFIYGTILGTFLGIITFAFSGKFIIGKSFDQYFQKINLIFGLFFLTLFILQAQKLINTRKNI